MNRKITIDDIPIVNGWYLERKFPDMTKALPSCGFLVEEAGAPVAACFAYRDIESRMCWLAWFVTIPGLKPRHSAAVLKSLVAYAEDELKKLGYPLLFATGRKGLGKMLSGSGWCTGDLNINQYFKIMR